MPDLKLPKQAVRSTITAGLTLMNHTRETRFLCNSFVTSAIARYKIRYLSSFFLLPDSGFRF
ncbi:MAG: hypothetical protein HC849_26515 [Oscillatoriales cyanobacterium RU_3_3]|nr:hypothetical protein [Oscillatoriales cyanobacterium RU_3_3]